MRITIFVKESDLETLYQFLNYGREQDVKWSKNNSSPKTSNYIPTTISYTNFIKLKDITK